MLLSSKTLQSSDAYCYTVEAFFYSNLLWRIRQVDLACYNNATFDVADVLHTRLRLACVPMSATRIIQHLNQFVHVDDWVDVIFLDGLYVRNIQRL